MAVNLIVEDGSGLPNANTYIDVTFAKEYAANRGIDLGTDDAISANLVLAADYIEAHGPYKGKIHNPQQALLFPRDGLKSRGEDIPDGSIPTKLKQAQAQLLIDIKESGALMTSNRQFALKRRKLDVLEQEYAVGSYAAYSPQPAHQMYDSLMGDFTIGNPYGTWAIR